MVAFVELSKQSVKEVSIDSVILKLHSFRTCFVKELARYFCSLLIIGKLLVVPLCLNPKTVFGHMQNNHSATSSLGRSNKVL